jgi:hypothetical protein
LASGSSAAASTASGGIRPRNERTIGAGHGVMSILVLACDSWCFKEQYLSPQLGRAANAKSTIQARVRTGRRAYSGLKQTSRRSFLTRASSPLRSSRVATIP